MNHNFEIFAKHDNGRIIYKCPVCKTKTMTILDSECVPAIDRQKGKTTNIYKISKIKKYERIMYSD